MPIYNYACPDCNIQTEEVRPITEYDLLPACPQCRAPMSRVFGMPRFKMTKSDYEAAREVMEDDALTRNPAVVKAAMKRIHYERSIW